jgi:hypothetical protein
MFISMTDPNPAPRPRAAQRGRTRTPHDLVLRVTLADIEPAIWRLVRVPDEYTLHQLHRVFQLLFGWQDYHLYDFLVGESRFEAPDPEAEGENARRVRLRAFGFKATDRFSYRYDWGDGWEHEIVVKEVLPVGRGPDDPRLPALLGGARAGPHEDSGGPHGYADMVQALRNRKSSQYRMHRDWAGPLYDPERFDPWLAGQNLVLAAAWGVI